MTHIERTIKKASGDIEGLTYEEMTYEGYGPHGVAVMVEVLTDNRNRSAAEIRHIFNKYNGNLGESGVSPICSSVKAYWKFPQTIRPLTKKH